MACRWEAIREYCDAYFGLMCIQRALILPSKLQYLLPVAIQEYSVAAASKLVARSRTVTTVNGVYSGVKNDVGLQSIP